MRWYKGAKPKFGNTEENDGLPRFWDVSFGGTLPILILKYGDSDYVDTTSTNRAENYGQMRTKATDMFLAAGAHMLLDFHSRSNAVYWYPAYVRQMSPQLLSQLIVAAMDNQSNPSEKILYDGPSMT